MNAFIFLLTNRHPDPYNLNMFKTTPSRPSSEATRSLILTTALDMFRRRGVNSVTMREIAQAAGVALGAAYYYFPSKEAMVQAYYDKVQDDHRSRVSSELALGKHNLLERLKIAFHLKVDILKGDRELLGTLFRYTGEPSHPLSVLGPATQVNRKQSIAVFQLAIGDEPLPEDIATVLPLALWALSMSILLYFIYDESPQQERTHKLIDGALEIVVRLLSIAKSPLLRPARGSVFALLRDTGLLPEATPPAPHSTQEV